MANQQLVLNVTLHVSTDGENKNVCQHHSSWQLLVDERNTLGLGSVPLLKSVSALHSSALAFKDVCRNVTEVPFVMASLVIYFHTSARMTRK